MARNPKVEYTKPTSQLDLEARLGDDSTPVFNPAENPAPVSEDGFVGVSPEYQNYANDTDKPLASEDGVEQVAEELFDSAYGDAEDDKPSESVMKNYESVTAGTQASASEGDDSSSDENKSE